VFRKRCNCVEKEFELETELEFELELELEKTIKSLPLREGWDGCCDVYEVEKVTSDSALQRNDNLIKQASTL
jgi:hypothetical protein